MDQAYTAISVTEFSGSKSPASKYRARTYLTAPNGNKKRLQVYGRTKKEAREKCLAKINELISKNPNEETLTVKQLIAKMLGYKKAQGKKRKTITDYAQMARLHIIPSIGEIAITEVTTKDVADIQHKLVEQGKYRTAEMTAVTLSTSYRYAQKMLFDITNPCDKLEPIKRPHIENPKDIIWTHEQMKAFLTLAEEEYERLSSLYYPLYRIAMSAGLRRGELLGLTWNNVKTVTKNGSMTYLLCIRQQYTRDGTSLYKETPKTSSGVRDVPISKSIYDLLMEHKKLIETLKETKPDFKDRNFVFPNFKGNVINPDNLRRSFNNLIRRANVPPMYFHNLRKCAATYITQELVKHNKYAPKIVQNILGHSRIDVALEVYTKVIEDDLQYATFDPLAE